MNISKLVTGNLLFLIFLVGISGLVFQGTDVSGGGSDQAGCVRHNPLISVVPASQTTSTKQTVYYNVTVENTDGISAIEYELSWVAKGDLPRGAVGAFWNC